VFSPRLFIASSPQAARGRAAAGNDAVTWTATAPGSRRRRSRSCAGEGSSAAPAS